MYFLDASVDEKRWRRAFSLAEAELMRASLVVIYFGQPCVNNGGQDFVTYVE